MQIYDALRLAESTDYDIPVPPAPGSTELSYVKRPYRDLKPPVKAMITLPKDQLYNRLISAGPTKTALLALMGNPFLVWPLPFLTTDQVASAEAHFTETLGVAQAALRVAQAALDSGAAGLAAAPGPVVLPAAVVSAGAMLPLAAPAGL